MRSGVLSRFDWKSLYESGFRFVLMGLESANNSTLERLNKGYAISDVICACRTASENGINVHLTFMVGFPWETRQDVERTVELSKSLFKKGYIKSLQVTTCIPYPGTRLFNEAKENGWLLTEDWTKYDQTQKVMKSCLSDYEINGLKREIYLSCLNKNFILKKLFTQNPLTTIRQAGYLWKHL